MLAFVFSICIFLISTGSLVAVVSGSSAPDSCGWMSLGATRKPDYDDGNSDGRSGGGSGNEVKLPLPVVDPSTNPRGPDPEEIFGPVERSVIEVTSEQGTLFAQINKYLTEQYPNWLNRRRLISQRKAMDDAEVQFTYFVAPGCYEMDLMKPMNISDPRAFGGWNASRPDLNPFFFGSFHDFKVEVEVWETERPVGLQAEMAVYRRLILRGRRESLEALLRLSYEYFATVETGEDTILAYTSNHWGGWGTPQKVPKRPLNTVYLDGDIREAILSDLAWFYDSKDLYKRFAIPYRRSYLLAGPPGTGKTSLIRALASEMDKSIGLVQFSKWFGPSDLAEALASIPADFLVVEDVDGLYTGRHSDPNRNGLTFSDFINVIDGICSREGIVLFMTTNHPDRLDPALIRPGRVDFRVNMGYVTKSQLREMFHAYFPEESADSAESTLFDEFWSQLQEGCGSDNLPLSAAELQNFFFRHYGCENISDHIGELLERLRNKALEEHQENPCKAYIGMDIDKARKQADQDGHQSRIVRVDDEYFAVTLDHCPDRVNFAVDKSEVTECHIG